MEQQETITQARAAAKFGVTDRTIRRWERAKLITGKKVLGHKVYPLDQLRKLVGLISENVN